MYELKEKTINKIKLDTMISLRQLRKETEGSLIEKTIIQLEKDYYSTWNISRDSLLAFLELENIISVALKVENPLTLHIITGILYNTVKKNIDLTGLDQEEIGEKMVRNMLHIVGYESESLVKVLAKEFLIVAKVFGF